MHCFSYVENISSLALIKSGIAKFLFNKSILTSSATALKSLDARLLTYKNIYYGRCYRAKAGAAQARLTA